MVQPSNALSALLTKLNLDDLSSADLKQLRGVIDSNISIAESREMAQAREQIQAIAKSVGLSLSEIMNTKSSTRAKGEPLPVKYRNPENSKETWSGRGRQPKWVNDKLAEGKTLAQLEVKPS